MIVKIRRYLDPNEKEAEYYHDVDVVQCDERSDACIVWVGSPDEDKVKHDIIVTIQPTDRIVQRDRLDIWVVGESFNG
ncbi:hypothetical protein LCGC14_2700100 [marine sediment metagenome]|uniref:Uncharacterized protein n=1 Tax=marine sediment metagenome TaxID=412755 RepID=A0A0F9A3K2_9ZZZZ